MKLEIRIYSNFIHTHTQKNLEMDQGPKCKAGQYKILRGKHKQNVLLHKS